MQKVERFGTFAFGEWVIKPQRKKESSMKTTFSGKQSWDKKLSIAHEKEENLETLELRIARIFIIAKKDPFLGLWTS